MHRSSCCCVLTRKSLCRSKSSQSHRHHLQLLLLVKPEKQQQQQQAEQLEQQQEQPQHSEQQDVPAGQQQQLLQANGAAGHENSQQQQEQPVTLGCGGGCSAVHAVHVAVRAACGAQLMPVLLDTYGKAGAGQLHVLPESLELCWTCGSPRTGPVLAARCLRRASSHAAAARFMKGWVEPC